MPLMLYLAGCVLLLALLTLLESGVFHSLSGTLGAATVLNVLALVLAFAVQLAQRPARV